MNRETLLAVAIAAVVAASAVAAAAVPGALAEPESDDVRPSYLDIEELSISPGEVSGATATLSVETRLDHRGGDDENVTVLARAVHLDSGLVETTDETAVPTISGDREVAVVQNLSVERSGGYRIETVVFRDGERVAEGRKEVRGVGTLTPAYAETDVRVHWLGGELPAVEYSVADADGNRTALNVSTSLTNEGDADSEQLRVVLTARQADSNIVADRTTVRVGSIAPGRTASPSAELVVPDGYNYYLDAVLWKDGVVVGTARSAANLNPTETLAVNETVREVGVEVSDFERDDDAPRRETTGAGYDAGGDGGIPGFTAVGALAGLLGAILLARRQA
jgi:PGF-CTERM protein